MLSSGGVKVLLLEVLSKLGKRDGAGLVLVNVAEELLGGVLENVRSLLLVCLVESLEFLDSEFTVTICVELLYHLSSAGSVVNHIVYLLIVCLF